MIATEHVRDEEALGHVDRACLLASTHEAAAGDVSNAELAVLLGMIVRRLDELAHRLEHMEAHAARFV